jgi:hemerythrin
MVIWSEKFECGSPRIDLQHRMLINNINHLEGMLTSTNPTPEELDFLIHLVNFLEAYAETHFTFEEQCMDSYRCPAHQQNKEQHQQYRDFFHNFKQRYTAEGFRPEVLKELHETASAWIENHILRVDRQLKPCLKGAALPA